MIQKEFLTQEKCIQEYNANFIHRKQLENKENKSSETILRKCVHCGMCNATCPTYGINGDELEGPRGRIYLIKDMLRIINLQIKK